MTAALTAGLDRIPDQLGYLVISEDGVLASAGELENDEVTAGVMMQMVRTASRFRLSGVAEPPFKRMSGMSLTCLFSMESIARALRRFGVMVFLRKVSILFKVEKQLSDSAVVMGVVMRLRRRLTVSVKVL
ncbi:ragulator complex protein LAMTOR4 isoform X1 [Eleginops maclovinus]|uniref:ragulator complex protein LAMTOR4 isoform X1 n=1 Tax=Eleginops maclovinus TaxID=56733 RepID=UPI0030808A84